MTPPALALAYQTPAEHFEGRVSHLYLDSVAIPTVAIGAAIEDLATSLRLPWRVQSTGDLAGELAVTRDYARVKSMEPGRAAAFYVEYESLVLRDQDIDALFYARVEPSIADLRRCFAGFDQFPLPAQLALLDMRYNLGLGRPPAAARKGCGLLNYVHLCAAVNQRDWHGASLECGRNTHLEAFAGRNQWTVNQFMLASYASAGVR